MGIKNKISEEYTYFLTMTVIDWVDIFTRPIYKQIIVNSLEYCQLHKGLIINAWCLMTNHLHLVAKASEGFHLSDILRDFKKFTSKEIVLQVDNEFESRRNWLLNRFEYAGKNDKKIKDFKFWQEGNEPKEIHTVEFLKQKVDYIHNNPVKAEIVASPEFYKYSSAIDYAGGIGLLKLEKI
ncbi:MAG: transposase [Bacteroidetes bacterium GWA2_30_7]|nr:MAG: transposase [Bacteroidetes bacterium GWA2_30_7]